MWFIAPALPSPYHSGTTIAEKIKGVKQNVTNVKFSFLSCC